MKLSANICLFALIIFSFSGTALAQDYDFHPTLSDNFVASIGAMRSSNSFKLSAEAYDEGTRRIDFNDSLNVDDHSTFFNGQLRWKFGKERKWSVWGQYFSNKATGKAELDEDVEWEGLTFRQGSYAEAGVKLAVTRVFFGRSFIKNAQNDFGLGVGIHNLDISAYIEGELIVDDETTGKQRGDVGANQILPNVGGWYNFSPARNWLIHSRVDWISANIKDYDGGLWNASAGVSYQAWRHVAFDLSWQYFNLHLKVSKSDWTGKTNMTYSGPVVSMVFAW